LGSFGRFANFDNCILSTRYDEALQELASRWQIRDTVDKCGSMGGYGAIE